MEARELQEDTLAGLQAKIESGNLKTDVDKDGVPYVAVILSPQRFNRKPDAGFGEVCYYHTDRETGKKSVHGIKADFRKRENVIYVRADELLTQVAEYGYTPMPAVCYRETGYGTYIDKETGKLKFEFNESNDFIMQNLFMVDIDNSEEEPDKGKGKKQGKRPKTEKKQIENPLTVKQALEILSENGLSAVAIYQTFSSKPNFQKFRIALVSDEFFTDKAERDAVQIGLISLFEKAADTSCKDAARMFYGSDKGCITNDEISWSNLCTRENLLKLAQSLADSTPEGNTECEGNTEERETAATKTARESKADREKEIAETLEKINAAEGFDDETVKLILSLPIKKQIGIPIPTGYRDKCLAPFALECLKAYDDTETARILFDLRAENCEEKEEKRTLNAIFASAQKKFHKDVKGNPNWTPPKKKKEILTPAAVEKALKDFDIDVRLNLISRKLEISDLPQTSAILPESYRTSGNKITKKNASDSLLLQFLTAYLREKGYVFSSDMLEQNISSISICKAFNPFLDEIEKTPWDGIDRVSETAHCLGIGNPECSYFRYYEKWLWQVVAMSHNHAGKYGNEFVLVLQGEQGIAKTAFFRKLAVRENWFGEGKDVNTDNKDSIMESTSVVICEFGELDATLVREQISLKNFITRPFDTFRPPYGKIAKDFPRYTAFCATVNPDEFLRDPTGSRRFVVIPVKELDKNFIFNTMTPNYCIQLWSQVLEQYRDREPDCFRLSDEEMRWSEAQNQKRNVMVDGEIELFDKLDFGRPVEEWKWYTNSQVSEALFGSLYRPNISATRLGKALNAAMARDKRIKKKRTAATNAYLLPPKNTGFEPVEKGVFEN